MNNLLRNNSSNQRMFRHAVCSSASIARPHTDSHDCFFRARSLSLGEEALYFMSVIKPSRTVAKTGLVDALGLWHSQHCLHPQVPLQHLR